jgi:hypothetical protein
MLINRLANFFKNVTNNEVDKLIKVIEATLMPSDLFRYQNILDSLSAASTISTITKLEHLIVFVSYPPLINLAVTNFEFFQKFIEIRLPNRFHKTLKATNPLAIANVYFKVCVHGGLYNSGNDTKITTTPTKIKKIQENLWPKIFSEINTPTEVCILGKFTKVFGFKQTKSLYDKFGLKNLSLLGNALTSASPEMHSGNLQLIIYPEHFFKINSVNSEDPQRARSNNYVHFYYDLSRMYKLLNIPSSNILRFKTYSEIISEHNIISLQVALVKNELHNASIMQLVEENAKKYNLIIGNIKYELIPTAQELVIEGQLLHHCVASYSQAYAAKECFIIRVQNLLNLEDRATMELRYNRIQQLKSYNNEKASMDILQSIPDYIKTTNIRNDISCFDLARLKLLLQPETIEI